MDDSLLEFNFWPSFADLMLSIVLVLVMILFIISAVLAVGIDISKIQGNQEAMVQELEAAYRIRRDTSGGHISLSITNATSNDIMVRNELDKQLLMFADNVLFSQDDATLRPRGKELLTVVGRTIRRQLSSLKEIQIQGHADTDPSVRFPSNLELAASRAIEVFKFFQDSIGIDPAVTLMSATSFGEFNPTERVAEDTTFTWSTLLEANISHEHKSKNRRVEVLLFYRN